MSTHNEPHHHPSTDKAEHGTTASYVIGFILSLLFTFIPYYLVVNKVLTGMVLTFAILVIAVLQMTIQLVFFLHLGRGPKPLYNVVFFFATAGIIVVTIGASLFIMANLYHNMTPQEVTTRIAQEENIAQIGGQETGACQTTHESYSIVIKQSKIAPIFVGAKQCDALTFVNEDSSDYTLVFGTPGEPQSYGGIYEISVRKGKSETVNLNEIGTFTFYASQNLQLTGHFSVTE